MNKADARRQVGKVYPSLEMRSAPSSSYIFIGTLAALEALIFTYWVGLKLYEVSSRS